MAVRPFSPRFPFSFDHCNHQLTYHSGCTFGLCSISFILAEAIPIFSYLIALTGSICFAPLAIMIPGWLWLYDHGHWRKGSFGMQIAYYLHWALILLGAFILVGGTYATVQQIINAYADGEIGELNTIISTMSGC